MHRILIAGVMLLSASGAGAYPTDLVIDAGALNIGAMALSDGRLAVVQLTNREPFSVRCSALFRNGPEQGRSRRAIIAPAGEGSLTWMPRRKVVRLRIELHCEPHDEPAG